MKMWVDFGGGNSNEKRFRVRTAELDGELLGEFDELFISGNLRLWSPSLNSGVIELDGDLAVELDGAAVIVQPRSEYEELPQ